MKSEDRPAARQASIESAREIATSFVAARRNATPLADYPGSVPPDLAAAYRIQDEAIKLQRDQIGGWKVGKIPLHLEEHCGIDRLAGPIFAASIHTAKSGDTIELPAFEGGFIAIEAEYVAVIAHDAPPDKTTWTKAESESMIDKVCIGLELASSPLRTINELGPAVVVSDFGNNGGLIVGPTITSWRTRSPKSMHCTSYVDGEKVGDGGAFTLIGGIVRSVQFLLELTARRGLALKAGDLVATGQTSGVHHIRTGQTGKIDFGEDGVLNFRIGKAQPKPRQGD